MAEYETIVLQPSIAEKLLYQHIEDNPSAYCIDGEAVKGDITFYPDDNYAGIADDAARLEHMVNQLRLEAIEPPGFTTQKERTHFFY